MSSEVVEASNVEKLVYVNEGEAVGMGLGRYGSGETLDVIRGVHLEQGEMSA